MIKITRLRVAKTPPLPDHIRADKDCVWDSDDFIPDEDGFNMSEYSPQGSYPESFWEVQARAVALAPKHF